MEREKFGSRLGFILVSAGCAVGLGNVWKFPYMCGQYGGAAFIAIYLVFLVILGYPIIVCEFAVGRGSQKSCATSFRKLEPKGWRWHYNGYIGMAGLRPTDDVLHHGNRLDAVLLFPLSDRLPDKSVYDNRAGFLLL